MKIKIFNSQKLNEVEEFNLAVATNNAQGECMLGRSLGSGLVLDGSDVSRLHGKIFRRDGNYYFCDLGSRNGSIVNGEIAKTNQNYTLQGGDILRIGEFVLIMEEISEIPENLPATVCGGIDATVISGWRSPVVDTPAPLNQDLKAEMEVPDLSSQATEAITPECVQTPEAVSEASQQTTSEVAEIETPMPQQTDDVSEVLKSTSKVETTYIQTPEAIAQREEVTAEPAYIQTPLVAHELSIEEEVAETETLLPEPTNEVTEVIEQSPEAVREVSETTFVQISETIADSETFPAIAQPTEELANPEITYVQMPEVSKNLNVFQETVAVSETTAPTPINEVPEVVKQTPEAEFFEGTDVWFPETLKEVEVVEEITQAPTEMKEISGAISHQEIITTQVPEEVEVFKLTSAPVSELKTQAPEEMTRESATIAPFEALVDEGAAAIVLAEETIAEPEVLAPSEEPVSKASTQEEAHEVVSQMPEIVSPVTDETTTPSFEETEIFDAGSQESEEHEKLTTSDATTAQVPEELSQVSKPITQTEEAVTEQNYVQNSEFTQVISHADTAATVAPDFISTSAEVVAEAPNTASDVPKIINQKYIALMAHDSKKSDLVQFLSKHKDFFSQCLTIATPVISETLLKETTIAISQQIPAVPIGGYQTIASLVGSGDILAVIFLRDLLLTQPGQANEEALLRLCNTNQVLFATNVPTAEALVYYIKNLVKFL